MIRLADQYQVGRQAVMCAATWRCWPCAWGHLEVGWGFAEVDVDVLVSNAGLVACNALPGIMQHKVVLSCTGAVTYAVQTAAVLLAMLNYAVSCCAVQVTRFLAAASSSFESLPLSTITQGVMLEVRLGLQDWSATLALNYVTFMT